MKSTTQLAKHLREVHSGGNWTWVNLKDQLADVTWEQATKQVYSFNTIATLVYHISYFVTAVLPVFKGLPLTSKDSESFKHPPINSQQDWEQMIDKMMSEAEELATLIEQLPEEKLPETFVTEKYGNYYRNILGIIEHTHYHMGQITLIKKIIQHDAKK